MERSASPALSTLAPSTLQYERGMLGQVLRVKGYYDITGLTSMILNDEYFGIFYRSNPSMSKMYTFKDTKIILKMFMI